MSSAATGEFFAFEFQLHWNNPSIDWLYDVLIEEDSIPLEET